MRKLKLQVQITVDGFITGTQGEMDWLTFPWTKDIEEYVTQITEPVDAILLGRNLAQGFIPHWAANPEGEDQKGIDKINNTKKYVFTKTLQKLEWANTEVVNGELKEEILKLKAQDGGDMIVYGGGTFVSALLKEELIDELHLFINPAAIGNGMPIFKGLEKTQRFKLQKAQTFECGIVLINYQLNK